METPEYVDATCPQCGNRTLHIKMLLTAKEIGTFSLAGEQLKFSAVEWPWLVCDSCDFKTKGKVSP